ncbi:MAG: LysR family transcriptional regulator [Planctomycetota bacterium]
MDGPSRFHQMLPIWPWLPQFRAVAETEHLPSAAEMCGTGPSSLSRSLSLLERTLGKDLFERSGRSLKLNHNGRVLLEAVRDAMRRVDDACTEVRDPTLRGPLKIASSGAVTTAFVAPAVLRLRSEHPGVAPELVTRPVQATANLLQRGTLDVAFQEEAVQDRGLTTQRVGSLSRGIYCGRHHELFDVASRDIRSEQLERVEFVAPPILEDGTTPDGWPPDRPRKVALTTDQLRIGLELCISQPLLAVLPDAIAEPRRGDLRRIDAIAIEPSPVFAVHREVLGPKPSAAARLAELVRR